jgi:hypothetical protein
MLLQIYIISLSVALRRPLNNYNKYIEIIRAFLETLEYPYFFIL